MYTKLKTPSKPLFVLSKFSLVRVTFLLERLAQVSGHSLSECLVDRFRRYSYFFHISGLCELCDLPYLHWLVSVAPPAGRGIW